VISKLISVPVHSFGSSGPSRWAMLFEGGTIVQVIVNAHSSVVDGDVETFDLLEGSLDLRRIGDVQEHRSHALVPVAPRLARSGVDPLGTSPQGFLN
jgi:hypothetical protein